MTAEFRIPPIEAVKEVHAREMARAGHTPRIRDVRLLESACARPANRANYDAGATVFDIAAELAYGLARNHPFVDGNKRIAFAAAYIVLRMNGATPDWTNRAAIETFQSLADGKLTVAALSEWLSENVLDAD